MNKTIDERVIETFDVETWLEDIPKILIEPGIGAIEDWLDKHKDNTVMINRFVDTFITCYEVFSPEQPKNIYTICAPDRVIDIAMCVYQHGDPVNHKLPLDILIKPRKR